MRLQLLHGAGAEGVAGGDHDLDAVLQQPVADLQAAAEGGAAVAGRKPRTCVDARGWRS